MRGYGLKVFTLVVSIVWWLMRQMSHEKAERQFYFWQLIKLSSKPCSQKHFSPEPLLVWSNDGLNLFWIASLEAVWLVLFHDNWTCDVRATMKLVQICSLYGRKFLTSFRWRKEGQSRYSPTCRVPNQWNQKYFKSILKVIAFWLTPAKSVQVPPVGVQILGQETKIEPFEH